MGIIIGEEYEWKNYCADESAPSYLISVLMVLVLIVCAEMVVAWVANKIAQGMILSKRIIQISLCISGALFLGFFSSTYAYQELHESIRSAIIKTTTSAEVLITGDVEKTSGGCFSLGEMRIRDGDTLTVRIFWPDTESAASVGEVCTVQGSFSVLKQTEAQHRFHEQMVGGTFSVDRVVTAAYEETLFSNVAKIRLWCLNELREDVVETDEPTALLESLLLGYRSDLSESTLQQDYASVGLAHMLAVSGTHLTILTALLISLLRMVRLGKKSTGICCLVFIVLYVMLTGLQASAVRSGLMTAAALLLWLWGRRRHALSALLVMASFMLIFQPCNAFSLGFQLSVVSCFAIIIFSSWMSEWLIALLGRWGALDFLSRKIIDPMSVTIVAQLVTAPLTIPLFAQFSVIAPVANCVILPISAVLLGGGFIALSIASFDAPFHALFLEAIRQLAMISNVMVTWLATLPGACMPVIFDQAIIVGFVVIVMCAAYILWPLPQSPRRVMRVRKTLCVIVAAAVIFATVHIPGSDVTITVMDVGQGDAILIRESGHTVLIDTGPSDADLLKALARNNVSQLDAVILTHFDSDHCAALGALRGKVSVARVLVSEGSLALATHDSDAAEVLKEAQGILGNSNDVHELEYQSVIQLGPHVILSVVWPEKSIKESDNEDSLCLLFDYDENLDGLADVTALFTGDAESTTLERVITLNRLASIDILKVAHHGSKKSITDVQVNNLNIQTACISVGATNRYGHPNGAIIKTLEDAGTSVYRTDEDGDIVITFGRTTYTVSCANIRS